MAFTRLQPPKYLSALRCLVFCSTLFVMITAGGCRRADDNGARITGNTTSGEIVLISRQNNSGTYAYFQEAVLGKENEFRLQTIDLSGSKEVVEMVANTPKAIGYSGMGYATDRVKMLSLAEDDAPAVAPTSQNASDGTYPLARPLNIYVIGEPEGPMKHYIDWILSSEGQKIVTEIGYVPAPDAGGDPPAGAPPEGSIKIAGSDTMVNLAQRWAEVYMEKYTKENGDPLVTLSVSGGGSGVGLAGLQKETTQLANASRDIKPKEREEIQQKFGKEVKGFVVALDALAVYVHPANPLDEISLTDLKQIFQDGGTITEWEQISNWPK